MGGTIGKDPRWDCEFCGKSLRTEDGSFDMVVMAVEVVAVVVAVVMMRMTIASRSSYRGDGGGRMRTHPLGTWKLPGDPIAPKNTMIFASFFFLFFSFLPLRSLFFAQMLLNAQEET